MDIRKLTKNGRGTYYVSIPKEYIKALGWRERQKLVVKKTKEGISIKDWKKG